jgi:single-strand DNA-binding protein
MAADINNVVMAGRLTRDAELKYTANGQAISKFSIAVNRRRKSGDDWTDEANFFDIALWGRQAEALNQYLMKGKQIGVQGELRQERWEKDGVNRSRVEIVASNIQLFGGNKDDQRQPTAAPTNSPPAASPEKSDDGFTDDIPF